MNTLIEKPLEEIKAEEKSPQKLTINSFTMLCVLGKGSYAKVILARKKDNGKIYALKILKKAKIEQKHQKGNVKQERNILIDCDHPFIVKLKHTF
mmetsp:Transcript_5647/g.4793  ORF Transcript_5647/g.4793 Transcript_5647/m.4793 type:complete len:95 (-) Transcript_5647:1042-1326(-)